MGWRDPPEDYRLDRFDRPGMVLWVSCQECHHAGDLPIADLLARYGRDVTASQALERMVCSVCGARKRAYSIFRKGPGDKPTP